MKTYLNFNEKMQLVADVIDFASMQDEANYLLLETLKVVYFSKYYLDDELVFTDTGALDIIESYDYLVANNYYNKIEIASKDIAVVERIIDKEIDKMFGAESLIAQIKKFDAKELVEKINDFNVDKLEDIKEVVNKIEKG